jgi:hypothetical protein
VWVPRPPRATWELGVVAFSCHVGYIPLRRVVVNALSPIAFVEALPSTPAGSLARLEHRGTPLTRKPDNLDNPGYVAPSDYLPVAVGAVVQI